MLLKRSGALNHYHSLMYLAQMILKNLLVPWLALRQDSLAGTVEGRARVTSAEHIWWMAYNRLLCGHWKGKGTDNSGRTGKGKGHKESCFLYCAGKLMQLWFNKEGAFICLFSIVFCLEFGFLIYFNIAHACTHTITHTHMHTHNHSKKTWRSTFVFWAPSVPLPLPFLSSRKSLVPSDLLFLLPLTIYFLRKLDSNHLKREFSPGKQRFNTWRSQYWPAAPSLTKYITLGLSSSCDPQFSHP